MKNFMRYLDEFRNREMVKSKKSKVCDKTGCEYGFYYYQCSVLCTLRPADFRLQFCCYNSLRLYPLPCGINDLQYAICLRCRDKRYALYWEDYSFCELPSSSLCSLSGHVFMEKFGNAKPTQYRQRLKYCSEHGWNPRGC